MFMIDSGDFSPIKGMVRTYRWSGMRFGANGRPPPLKMYVEGGGTPCFFIHFYLVPKMVPGKA